MPKTTDVPVVTSLAGTDEFVGNQGSSTIRGEIASLWRKNLIINGEPNVWQRGVSQSAAGYGSDDRWLNDNVGSTKVNSRQTFTLGQTDVAGNPKYYNRTIVTSVAGASNYALKAQRIENVLLLAGKTVTLSFDAKADAAKNIAISFDQNFGSGGSPSAEVLGAGVTHSLTDSWQRLSQTITLPSISGKTLGSAGGDYTQVIFWLDAGSTWDARTNSLGQQSGTFDIANVQVEFGNTATDFEQRPIGYERALCQRYYASTYADGIYAGDSNAWDGRLESRTSGTANGAYSAVWQFPVQMRATPAIALYSPYDGVAAKIVSGTTNVAAGTNAISEQSVLIINAATVSDATGYSTHATADAEI